MRRTESEMVELLREHGYRYCVVKYKHQYTAEELRQLCYKYRTGGLPLYQYPHYLKQKLSQGLTPAQIGEELGKEWGIIYRWMKNHKISVKINAFTEEDDKYIRFNAGYIPVTEMASVLQRPIPSIYHRMQTLGITMEQAIGYTVSQLSEDIGVPHGTIRNWIYRLDLQTAEADGTYRIALDETRLHDWLAAGNIYRIPKIPESNHYLMSIKRKCDEDLVSSGEIDRIVGKWVCNPKRGWPEKLLTVNDKGYGAFYLRADVYAFFWERRRLLDLDTIPADLPYWRELCIRWDSQYIYREEIALYVDYACKGPWFSYKSKYHGFPPNVGRWIHYYSRSAVLEWARASGKHPRLVRHLEQTIQGGS